MKYIKIIFAIVALPFFSSIDCAMEDTPFISLDEDFLSYASFPVNSYWIYEDVISGAKDSSYIISKRRFTALDYPTATSRNEIDQISQTEIINKDTVYGHIQSIELYGNIHYEYTHGRQVEQWFIRRPVLLKYVASGFDIPDSLQTSPKINTHDSIIINNQIYPDVVEVYYEEDTRLGYKKIFYAKNIGVVRRDNWNGSSWRLIRYHHGQ